MDQQYFWMHCSRINQIRLHVVDERLGNVPVEKQRYRINRHKRSVSPVSHVQYQCGSPFSCFLLSTIMDFFMCYMLGVVQIEATNLQSVGIYIAST
jgi:hypothetical protein